MKILHVAPVWMPISIDSHGGIETFLAELVTAEQRLGHEVTVVAAGGSDVSAHLVEGVPEALVPVMERGEAGDYQYYEQELIAVAARLASSGTDVVHNHVVPAGLLLDAVLPRPVRALHTLHGQVTQDLIWALRQSPHAVVAISRSQEETARQAGVALFGMTHNGIDFAATPSSSTGGDALLFLGRIEPQKGPDLAIRAARELGMRIVLAGPVTDRKFFDSTVRPLLGEGVAYVGVLGRQAKYEALMESRCLLAPSRWAEPFGMVAVEAMATGTPVVALGSGALREVVDNGVTGRVVDDVADLAAAVLDVAGLSRDAVRTAAAERFDVRHVAAAYLDHYARLLATEIPR